MQQHKLQHKVCASKIITTKHLCKRLIQQEEAVYLQQQVYGKELLIIHVYMDFMSPLVFFNLKENSCVVIQTCKCISKSNSSCCAITSILTTKMLCYSNNKDVIIPYAASLVQAFQQLLVLCCLVQAMNQPVVVSGILYAAKQLYSFTLISTAGYSPMLCYC